MTQVPLFLSAVPVGELMRAGVKGGGTTSYFTPLQALTLRSTESLRSAPARAHCRWWGLRLGHTQLHPDTPPWAPPPLWAIAMTATRFTFAECHRNNQVISVGRCSSNWTHLQTASSAKPPRSPHHLCQISRTTVTGRHHLPTQSPSLPLHP